MVWSILSAVVTETLAGCPVLSGDVAPVAVYAVYEVAGRADCVCGVHVEVSSSCQLTVVESVVVTSTSRTYCAKKIVISF